MTICRRKVLFSLLLSILIMGSVFARAATDSPVSRSYKVPLGELQHLISGWLEQQGAQVSTTASGMGKVGLSFEHNRHPFKIELEPESALATRVTLLGNGNDAHYLKLEESLWTLINAYTGPNGGNGEIDSGGESVPRAIHANTGAVVCINTRSNGMSSQFSGFVIDGNGSIICTAHDLKKYKAITITDRNGSAYLGKVIKLDLTKDLALIHSQLKPERSLSLATGRERLCNKEKIYAIGCPMNQLGKIVTGSVTTPPVKANRLHYWRVLLETSPGSSGSPVFDAQGVLVGMVKGRYRGTNTIGFLIPMDRIRAFLNE